MTGKDRILAIKRYVDVRLRKRPVFLNVEVTKRCNARCDFCDYWRTNEEERLSDYSGVVSWFRPFAVFLTGGEPLIRKDIVDLIRMIKKNEEFIFLTLLTNGSTLTKRKALKMREAGLNQLSISLDFLDERHDQSRGIPGLYGHIFSILPGLMEVGFENLYFNTVIRRDNLEEIPRIARQAGEWGVKVSFSAYCGIKTGNKEHNIDPTGIMRLKDVINELINIKRRSGIILNSDYYLKRVIRFFKNGRLPGCRAGKGWLQITPEGLVKPCSELSPIGHYSSVSKRVSGEVECGSCWYACRGEAQAPMTPLRIWELAV